MVAKALGRWGAAIALCMGCWAAAAPSAWAQAAAAGAGRAQGAGQAAGSGQAAAAASEPDRVVYHVDSAATQGLKALRNLRNHLDTAPATRIVVVTHADGVDMLMEGAKDDKSGTEYAPLVSALKARGVRFEVCEITLRNRKLSKDLFTLDADYTPSGVVRITQLQMREGFAYLKP